MKEGYTAHCLKLLHYGLKVMAVAARGGMLHSVGKNRTVNTGSLSPSYSVEDLSPGTGTTLLYSDYFHLNAV